MTNPLETETALLARRLALALDRLEAASAAQAATAARTQARLQAIETAAHDTLAGLDALLATAPAG